MPSDNWSYVLSVDGRDIELSDGEVTIGRSRTSTVRIDHESVSRSHALITFDRGNAVVKDLNSSNGTFVGGRRILNETRLLDGDRVQLGAAVIAFRVVAPAGPSERTALLDAKLAMSAPPPAVPATLPDPSAPDGAPVASGAIALPHPSEITADELVRKADEPVPRAFAAGAAMEALKNSASEAPRPGPEPDRDTRPGTDVLVPPPGARVEEPPSMAPTRPETARPAPPPEVPAVAPPVARPPASRPAPPRRPSSVSAAPRSVSEVPLHPAPAPLAPAATRHGAAELTPASFWARLGALVVDNVILAALDIVVVGVPILLVVFLTKSGSEEAGPRTADPLVLGVAALAGLVAVGANVWYVLGGWARNGRTPGKSLLGIAIVGPDGNPGIGWKAAFLRLLGMVIGAIPLYVGFLLPLFRPDRRALHDLVANTWVVSTR